MKNRRRHFLHLGSDLRPALSSGARPRFMRFQSKTASRVDSYHDSVSPQLSVIRTNILSTLVNLWVQGSGVYSPTIFPAIFLEICRTKG